MDDQTRTTKEDSFKLKWISGPLLKMFRKVTPAMSTEMKWPPS